MKRFLFVVPPFMGHVNPTLSLGKALLERGHEVAWQSVDEHLGTMIPYGGQYFGVRAAAYASDGQDHDDYRNKISSKNVTGIESVKFLYEEVLIPLNRYMYQGIKACVAAYKPDIIIHDHQLFSGAIVALQQGVKYATSVTAPAAIKMQQDLPGVSQWEDRQIIDLQHELNLRVDDSVACSPTLTLIYTSPEFFGDVEPKKGYRFVGPSITNRPTHYPFDWVAFGNLKYPKKVLVSIGTTFDHTSKKEFFSKVIAALGGQEMAVVVVSDPDLFDMWPSNFYVAHKIPQLTLLPLMDAVICHGGHNTVCESLMNGIPLVVVPIAYDQSYVAGRVVATACGIRLNYKRFKADQLNAAVKQVLHNAAFKEAALEQKEIFEQCGGVATAADLLEHHV